MSGLLVLAGCAGDPALLQAPPARPLPPPDNLFRKADVNAENEIDPELLAGLPPSTLEQHAAQAPSPRFVRQGTGKPAVKSSGPAAKIPRPAQKSASKPAAKTSGPAGPAVKPSGKTVRIGSVAVVAVKGAPGKGNAELARALRLVLRKASWPVYAKARRDSMRITGKVEMGPKTPRGQKVWLAWTVKAPNGKLLGVVRQENIVESGALDEGFGPAALPAAEGAAEGIFRLVRQLR